MATLQLLLTGMVKSAWALWLAGLLSVAFGVLIAVRPSSGALALIWIIGIYAILAGIVRLFAAYRVRSDQSAVKAAVRSLQGAPTRWSWLPTTEGEGLGGDDPQAFSGWNRSQTQLTRGLAPPQGSSWRPRADAKP